VDDMNIHIAFRDTARRNSPDSEKATSCAPLAAAPNIERDITTQTFQSGGKSGS